MDLGQLQAEVAKDEQKVVIPINKKDGSPYMSSDDKQCTITILGSESKAYRAARDASTKRALSARRTKLTPDDVMRNRKEQASAVVVDWFGWDTAGEPAACSNENVLAVLDVYHILEQVEDGIERHADFFAAQSGSSKK